MSKYIDAEKLKTKIRKHLIPTVVDRDYDEWEMGKDAGLQQAISIIDSLQQEQPEVDLEKVLSGFTGYYAHENSGEYPSAIEIARYFYKLGLNARKDE